MIQKFLDKVRPNFEDGGKLKAFRSVFEGSRRAKRSRKTSE